MVRNLRLNDRLAEVFSVDLRTLALFRVALALTLLVDLCWRLTDVRAFYTDFGIMPRDWLLQGLGDWRFTPHLLFGDLYFTVALFLIEMLALLAMALGWRSRLAVLVVAVLHASLQNRNGAITIGGDSLACCLLFWSLFLPLGARWSVDAALSTQQPPAENRHLSWASAGIVLQVLSVYFFSAILKSGNEWWPDGTAVYFAMHLDRYATPLGQWLLDFPRLMQGLSYFVYWLEWIGPLLALSPFLTRPLRAAVMLCLMAMHIGFILCLEIGPFPYISLSSLSLLLGGWFWDWRGRQSTQGAGLRIYYDRDCGFCEKMCQLFRTFFVLPQARIEPAQNDARAAPLLAAHYSWVVIDTEDRAHLKWPAFVALLRASPLFGWLAAPLGSAVFVAPGNAAYDFVGRHRGTFGVLSAALLPRRAVAFEIGPRWQWLAGLMLFAVLIWNFGTIKLVPDSVMQAQAPVLRLLRIEQLWNMFAPYPLKDDGWMVIDGRLEDGRAVNVLRPEQPVSFDKPDRLSQTHEGIRWNTYRGRLWEPDYQSNLLYYGRYLCRNWNETARPGERLRRFDIYYVIELTPPPGKAFGLDDRRLLWRHDCLGPSAPAKPAVGHRASTSPPKI